MPDYTNELLPGDIIVLDKFDMQHFPGEDKPIWIIYFGVDSIFDCPIFVYFCKTTTRIDDFKSGRKRDSHKYKKFSKGQYGFEEDCLIDFNEKPYTDITKEKFNSYTITKKGRLPNQDIKEIFERCLKKYLITPQLKSVRDSLAKAEIYIK